MSRRISRIGMELCFGPAHHQGLTFLHYLVSLVKHLEGKGKDTPIRFGFGYSELSYLEKTPDSIADLYWG